MPAAARERAAAVLIDLGWDGRDGTMTGRGRVDLGYALRGAVIAVAVAAVLVVLRVVLRGL